MRSFLILLRRELAAFLFSPVAYITTIFFLLVTGFSFWVLALVLSEGPSAVNVLQALFESLFFWIAFLLIVPVITMRLFAEETRSGTFETLMTAPVSDLAVVLAKFFSALAMFVLMWIPTCTYLVLLNRLSPMTVSVDPGPVITGYAGAFLVGAAYIALGLLMSSMTRNQVVAAVATFAVFGLYFFTGLLELVLDAVELKEFVSFISAYEHMSQFARGVVDSRPVVLYLSITIFLLFATVKVVESRRWKS